VTISKIDTDNCSISGRYLWI